MLFFNVCAVLCSFCLICDYAVADTTGATSTILPPTTKSLQNLYTRKQLATITKRFTNYYLYFGEFTNTVRNNGGLPVGVCFPANCPNTTQALLSTSLTNSVRKAFINRILTREQISWKNKSDEKRKNAPSGNRTADASAITPVPTPDENDAQNSEENEKNKNNRIHDHLVFVMLLPNHPYSQDVRKIMTIVSPMFPHAMVVLGNAYEFKDMTTKYYVTSYPKILYFRSGIYIESFEGVYSAEDVAAQLADWTYSLPRAIPVPFRHTTLAYRTANTLRKLDMYAPNGHMRLGLALHPLPLTVPYTLFQLNVPGWLAAYLPTSYTNNSMVSTVLSNTSSEYLTTNSTEGKAEPMLPPDDTISETGASTSDNLQSTQSSNTEADSIIPDTTSPSSEDIVSQSQDIFIQLSIAVPIPNVEPFLGSLENYATWDTRMFLIAGAYVIIRVIYLLQKWFRKVRV